MPLECLDGEFRELVQQSVSLAAVVRGLGRACVGSSYRLVRREIARLRLDTGHWKGRGHGTTKQPARLTPESVLVEHGHHSTGNIKKVVLRERLLPYACVLCGLGPEWNGKLLVLRLDHKNGRRSDHRLSNLRFLCPNCDSQTDTFCGRNKPKRLGKTCVCGASILATSLQCRSCSQRCRPVSSRPSKIQWPSNGDLIQAVEASSYEALARKLGVSSNAIRKRLRSRSPQRMGAPGGI